MSSVLQLCRRFESRPELPQCSGFSVRVYGGESDIEPWLELRHQAFARQRIGVRQWSRADFLSEFLNRWWWQPKRMWLVEAAKPSHFGRGNGEGADSEAQRTLIGAVVMSMRGETDQAQTAKPAVHWLIVHPRWRRRGVGRLLMAHLEAAACDAGHREVRLETHAAWEAAVKFYRSLGYVESQK